MVSGFTEGIEEVPEKPQGGSDQNQWMKADESNAEKLEDRHPRPSIVVCIRDDKPRKCEEEIDCEIRVFDECPGATEAKRVIEDVEDHDQKCSTASQPIQHFKMLFSAAGVVDNDGSIHQSDHSTVGVSIVLPRVLLEYSSDSERQLIARTQRTTRVPVNGVLSDAPPTKT